MSKQICSRCINDNTVPNIVFDENGVCNYCKMMDQLQEEYKTGTEEGKQMFLQIVEEIKRAGKGKQYDCVIGVSGGTDSSYMVHMAVKEWGLRPLAVHYDNTWNTGIATENIRKILGALKVDLYTHVVDNKESDDVFKSFLKAGVPELDSPTDLALTEVLYEAANKYGVKYILEGHSYKTEGISPLGIMYMDGKYISDVHKRFGSVKMKTFPNMPLGAFLKWTILKKIKKIRPLWYVGYSKEQARQLLEQEYGWKYYGGHHLENRMSAFHHSVYHPQRFKIDQRYNALSAAVRSGFMDREEALKIYAEPPYVEPELVSYFKKRMALTDAEYEAYLHAPKKFFWDYKTYKRTFERMRPLFYLLYKSHLVPKSFYMKFCFPLDIEKMKKQQAL
ncbi:MAG: LPS biosynthesis protein [Bacteroidetes bacterium 43-93]|nr:N-acetyl sugar amidotransferase [Bacteroidota bacterium]OJW99414.1 MAG: LPS biosynthesis protein [Bacteroidetes bacterium 43-93]